MTTTGYRIIYALLGLGLAAVIGASIFFLPSGDAESLPAAVENYSPKDLDIVTQPVTVMIDVVTGYTVTLTIDGTPVPPSQIDAIEATGRYQFDPGPGKVIERWSPGNHTVVATYVGGPGNVDAGNVVWTFTVK